MECSITVDAITIGWSIVYIEGLQVIISKNIIFLSLRIDFVLANSTVPNEMPPYTFNLGLQCLPKEALRTHLSVYKGLIKLFVSVWHTHRVNISVLV